MCVRCRAAAGRERGGGGGETGRGERAVIWGGEGGGSSPSLIFPIRVFEIPRGALRGGGRERGCVAPAACVAPAWRRAPARRSRGAPARASPRKTPSLRGVSLLLPPPLFNLNALGEKLARPKINAPGNQQSVEPRSWEDGRRAGVRAVTPALPTKSSRVRVRYARGGLRWDVGLFPNTKCGKMCKSPTVKAAFF